MKRAFWIAILALCLAGCGPTPEDDQAVQNFFEEVRLGRYDAIQGDLADNLKTPETIAQLEEVGRAYVPSEPPTRSTRINWRTTSIVGGDTTASYVYRYDYPDRVLIVSTATRRTPEGETLIEGFHVNVTPITAETLAAGEFSIMDKPPRQLAFLTALACSVLLMLTAFFGAIFTKGFKRKWLFAPIALLGFPVFLMNWSTGAWVSQFMFGLINTGVTRGLAPLDPWMLKFQIPIGALIVLSLLWPRWFGGYATPEERETTS